MSLFLIYAKGYCQFAEILLGRPENEVQSENDGHLLLGTESGN